MRRFALLTGAIVLGLAALAVVLPGTDRYVHGVDDDPPQRFKKIAEAERAAGFDNLGKTAPVFPKSLEHRGNVGPVDKDRSGAVLDVGVGFAVGFAVGFELADASVLIERTRLYGVCAFPFGLRPRTLT